MIYSYTPEGVLSDSGAVPTKIYCCNRCGCAVINQWMHDKWHAQMQDTSSLANGLRPIR